MFIINNINAISILYNRYMIDIVCKTHNCFIKHVKLKHTKKVLTHIHCQKGLKRSTSFEWMKMEVRITSFLKSLSRLLSLLPGHLLRAADVHLQTAQLACSLQAALTQLSRVQPTVPQPNQSLDFNNENTRLYLTQRDLYI